METPRDKYYSELLKTIIYCNNSNDAPFTIEKIRYAMHIVITEEELDPHNWNVDTFSQTSNTQRENKNNILKSEKRDKWDMLA